jgi:NAD(P) transhydrogenase
MQANEYDLVVIGSGPAGQKGAICAAKMRKKVAIMDRRLTMGGVCVHTGTIPSKVLREAVLYLSGLRQRMFCGRGYVVKDRIMMSDLVLRAQSVMTREVDVIKAQLRRNYVTALEGDAHFADPHTIEIVSEEGVQQVRGEKILIACGTRPAHIDGIPVDGQRILDSDQVHLIEEIPRELIVVGAGIIGLEYASMFAALGVKVTLLDQRPTLLDFVDRCGLARYSELAKGQMLGDDQGLLKILFDPDTLKLLGVHIIGDRAAEIVHIGQVVLTMGATIEYFRDTVFNYPTLAEAYKVAALDGLNKL